MAEGAFRRYFIITRNTGWAFLAGAPVAFVIGLLTGDRLLAVALGLVVMLVGFALAWLPLLDRRFRLAKEVFEDHNCHEAADWKKRTGTKMPQGLKQIEQWLTLHPNTRGRVALLLPMGRLAEADAAIAAYVPESQEDAFGVELLRETRTLLTGGDPDIDRLNALWLDLPNDRERRHRRECLAFLEAQAAVAKGTDPVVPLEQARNEVAEVYWRYKTAWFVLVFFAFAAVPTVLAGLLAASIGFRGLS